MTKFDKVEYTRQIDLVFLLLSTIGLWILVLKILISQFENRLIPLFISIIISTIYFFILKRKIVRFLDFELFNDKFTYGKNSVDFDSISEYKIHWLKGAGLRIKLKSGKIIRLSSNDNFCDSRKFVQFCENLDLKLENYDSRKIIRKDSFFETKKGFYFVVIMTTLVLIVSIYKLITGGNFNFMNVLGIIICLGIIWTGIRLKK